MVHRTKAPGESGPPSPFGMHRFSYSWVLPSPLGVTRQPLGYPAPVARQARGGHSAVNTVVFDTLQDDLIWTVDDKGYNFKHTIDVSSAQAFETAGLFYRVRYNLTPVSGQVIVVRFKLKAI